MPYTEQAINEKIQRIYEHIDESVIRLNERINRIENVLRDRMDNEIYHLSRDIDGLRNEISNLQRGY